MEAGTAKKRADSQTENSPDASLELPSLNIRFARKCWIILSPKVFCDAYDRTNCTACVP